MRTLKKFLGWVLTLTGLPFVVMAASDLVNGDPQNTGTGVLWGLMVLFGGIAAGGIQLLRGERPAALPPGKDPAAQREVLTLRLAAESGGTLGPSELAAKGGMSFSEARAQLDALAKVGACELVVTETGSLFYRFPDLLVASPERQNAKGVLEG